MRHSTKSSFVQIMNGLLPFPHEASILTNIGLLLIGPLRTNFSKIFIIIYQFSIRNKHLSMSSAKWRPFCSSLNVFTPYPSHKARFTWRLGWTVIHYSDGISNYRRLDGLLNRLFRCRSKKTSKLCVTGLSKGNSPVTGEFPSQRASNTENVSIWWRHHVRLR